MFTICRSLLRAPDRMLRRHADAARLGLGKGDLPLPKGSNPCAGRSQAQYYESSSRRNAVSTMSLKQQINDQVKQAMKAGEKARLKVLRMLTAAIKQKEVDERIELDDSQVLAIIDKQVKQRRESIEQYRAGDRDDLADAEQAEIEILSDFLPKQLSQEEIDALIDQAIADTGASGMADMGKVMGKLKPEVQGRADMKAVSQAVRTRLV